MAGGVRKRAPKKVADVDDPSVRKRASKGDAAFMRLRRGGKLALLERKKHAPGKAQFLGRAAAGKGAVSTKGSTAATRRQKGKKKSDRVVEKGMVADGPLGEGEPQIERSKGSPSLFV